MPIHCKKRADKKSEQVRLLRIVEYIGERSLVEETVRRSIHGEKSVEGGELIIRVTTLGAFPDLIENSEVKGV